MCPNLNCISIMMSFLTYSILQDFLWTLNFCRFWPIMQIRKKGGWNLKKIFSSEITEPISTKLCWNDSWVISFKNCVRHFRPPTMMAATAELNLTQDHIGNCHKNFLSETICSIRTKFWWNSHWMVLFQKCVRRFSPLTKMAPTAELSLTYMYM